MTRTFKSIGFLGRQRHDDITEVLWPLCEFLQSKGSKIILEQETAELLDEHDFITIPGDQLSEHCDLLIIVGGDGNLLRASRLAIPQDLPVLGINRGRLGFLTDIHPDDLAKVGHVIDGNYIEEKRFALQAEVLSDKKSIACANALNDVVLLPGRIAHMTEFQVFINGQFVCNQRADGFIVATPTGSTAYALSGGGPILHPKIDCIVLVPICPHTLSSRPIVVSADSKIELVIAKNLKVQPTISCDGQQAVPIPENGRVVINRLEKKLRLIHPEDYNYYETLRKKLRWEGR